MFSSAALHPVAYFAILSGISGYLYIQERRRPFLLWSVGWVLLTVPQLLCIALAGILVLLGAASLERGTTRSATRAAAVGALLLLAAVFAAGLVSFGAMDLPRAAALGVLASAWLAAGALLYRWGGVHSGPGARIAGLALGSWGLWLPLASALGAGRPGAGWPSEVTAALGAVVIIGVAVLAVEITRSRGRRPDARRLLDDDPNMVAILQKRRIVYANPAFLEVLGYRMADLERMDPADLISPSGREEALLRRDQRERGEPITDYETEIMDMSGGRHAVIVHGDLVEWDGAPAFKYELTDMTKRREAEAEVRRIHDELMRMNAELERANRLQSEFLSNTTHELKTPLTSIMANTEILEYEMCGPVNEEQRRVLGTIGRNSQHLLEMISRLLDFARARAGVGTLRLEEVRPREILDGVAETVRPLLEGKEVRLEVEAGPGADEACWLDGEKMYRVYLNLVENAIKFSTRGTIRASAAVADGVLEGSVADEGIGIPSERREDIFEAFTQVDASSTRSYPGVGLGLAICKQLVELHGGSIWAESEAGRGSTFRFRVPCMPPVVA